jgi:hypothetical protein
MTIVFYILVGLWIAWAIGYPIYAIITHKSIFGGGIYALGASIGALLVNTINLIVKYSQGGI